VSASRTPAPRSGALPPDFAAASDEAWAKIRATTGFLTEREARFLVLAAAAAPAAGAILEIGSFKGRSTVGLATIARRYGLGKVVAVDPHTAPSITDPSLQGKSTTFDDFQASLRAAGVEEHVEVHRAYSQDLARTWTRPIRLLWIDGDHTFVGAQRDLDCYRRFLQEGAIVALHDSLSNFDGPIRVMVESLLASDDFGPAGFHGSIAWAQFRPRDGARFRGERQALAARARRLVPFVEEGLPLTGLRRLRFKAWRALVPHGDVDPAAWMARVGLRD
jgi:predicted O-methyltransferase YrrM